MRLEDFDPDNCPGIMWSMLPARLRGGEGPVPFTVLRPYYTDTDAGPKLRGVYAKKTRTFYWMEDIFLTEEDAKAHGREQVLFYLKEAEDRYLSVAAKLHQADAACASAEGVSLCA